MTMRWPVLLLLGLVMLAGASGPVSAIEQRPLPAFTVLTADGLPVDSEHLSGQPRWLIVYVVPDCASCDRLLRGMKGWQSPQLAERMVVLVGARREVAAAYMSRILPRELQGVPWFADASGQAWQSLEITGTPLVIGVQQGRLEWAMSGVLGDPGTMAAAVRTWTE